MLAIPELSDAVGGVICTEAEQEMISAGQWIIGFSLSVTVITCVHVLLLPQLSVAVHTTFVVPIGYCPLALALWL
jgi:hypothetical protein